MSAAVLVANVWLPKNKKLKVSEVLSEDLPAEEPAPLILDESHFDRYMAERAVKERAAEAKRRKRR